MEHVEKLMKNLNVFVMKVLREKIVTFGYQNVENAFLELVMNKLASAYALQTTKVIYAMYKNLKVP